jgi:hypothetical protein
VICPKCLSKITICNQEHYSNPKRRPWKKSWK